VSSLTPAERYARLRALVEEIPDLENGPITPQANVWLGRAVIGPVAELVGIEGGVVSGVFNLESSGVEAPDRRPRHEEHYHEA
jgi:hypothetical protein